MNTQPTTPPLPDSMTDSPILITGAGGFIGSHLVEQCLARGARVRAFVHYNGQSRWGWLEELPGSDAVEVVAGDIRDYDSVFRAVQGCRTVFHLAALIGIPYSYVSPQAYIRTNVEGTYNVLEAARALGVDRLVVTSTSETYGTAQYAPIDERHPAVAQSPYAATKVAADQLAASYYRSFGLPVRVLRPFNTFGPRQSARAFIPTVITQILAGRRRIRLGNLTPTRDYTFVQDTVDGFLSLAEAEGLDGLALNVGTGSEISMGDLAHRIARLLEVEIELECDTSRLRPADSEVERLLCDASRMRELTSWHPRFTLDDGLLETIAWFRRRPASTRADLYHL